MTEAVEFESDGGRCRGYLYVPQTTGRALPCVVMGHGFGLTQACGLQPFAQALSDAGFVALTFDYRHFGQSEGHPRQLLSFGRQLADWRAAVRFARSLDVVDHHQIVTWGTSLGAGHAVTTAVDDPTISGTIAQNPMLDGLSSTWAAMKGWGVVNALTIVGTGLLDVFGQAFRRPRRHLPMGAPAGELGLLTSPDAYAGYKSIVTPDFDFRLVAQIAIVFLFYRPLSQLRKLHAPLLLLPCTRDKITPVGQAYAAKKRVPSATLVEFDCEHFEIYSPPHRERALEHTVAFLEKITTRATPPVHAPTSRSEPPRRRW